MKLFLQEGEYAKRSDRASFVNDVRNAVLSVLSEDFPLEDVLSALKAR
jgi:hypothetical protein